MIFPSLVFSGDRNIPPQGPTVPCGHTIAYLLHNHSFSDALGKDQPNALKRDSIYNNDMLL